MAWITRTADEPFDVTAEAGGEAEEQTAAPEVAEGVVVAEGPEPEVKPVREGRIFASPRAKKLAREEGVDLAYIDGSGPNGRIIERDVQAYITAVPKATPVAQRVAEQLGVDLRTVTGTGPKTLLSSLDSSSSSLASIWAHRS